MALSNPASTSGRTTRPPSSLSRENTARGPSYLCISSIRQPPTSSPARAPSCPPKTMARGQQQQQQYRSRRPSLPGPGNWGKATRVPSGTANTSVNYTTMDTIPEIAITKPQVPLLDDFDKVLATLKKLTKLCQESANVTEGVVLPLLSSLPIQTSQEDFLAWMDSPSTETDTENAQPPSAQLYSHLTKSLLKSSEAHRLAMVIELGMYFLRGKLSHESQSRGQIEVIKTQEELVLARKRILELEDVVGEQAVEIERGRKERAGLVTEMEGLVKEMEGLKDVFGKLRERIVIAHGQGGAGGSGSGGSRSIRGEGVVKRREREGRARGAGRD